MPKTETIVLPHGLPGSRRELHVYRFGNPGQGPKAYIQASLHADELPGGLVAHHLIRLLEGEEMTGELVIVPAANPIGLGQFAFNHHIGRYEMGGGENFNRNFPDLYALTRDKLAAVLGPDEEENRRLVHMAVAAALDEQTPADENAALKLTLMRLAHDADIVLDLHCDYEALMHIYLGTDLWPEARDLAGDLGAPVTLLAHSSGGNPFDEAFSTLWWQLRRNAPEGVAIPLGCLSATVELRGQADVEDALARRDAEALLRFLKRRGVIAGDPGPLADPPGEATPLNACELVRAPAGGIIVFRASLGERIEAGDIIGEILDPTTQQRHEITARTDGLLFSRFNQRWARPHEAIAKIAGTTPLPDRQGYLMED